MTNSFARILALPFALILIFVFTTGGLDFSGPKTYLVLISLTALALIYVFNGSINKWWWKRRMPNLDRTLTLWIQRYSKYYQTLSLAEKEQFEKRIAVFNLVKNFTLKVGREFQLEEDVKTIISHEFMRITMAKGDFLYSGMDHFIVYNHAFGSPDIQKLHTIEINREDGVIILSKEQLINGFLQPHSYVNSALLAAVMSFIHIHPRLDYPDVMSLELEDIAEAHQINLDTIKMALGLDWINRLDLLIFCYWMYPDRTASFNKEIHDQLASIFRNSAEG